MATASISSKAPAFSGTISGTTTLRRSAAASSSASSDLDRILKLAVPVCVTLAERNMTIDAILDITAGTIIEFGVSSDSELTLRVGHRTIGKGQAVKTGERFGLRLSSICTVEDRIDAMGPGAGTSKRPSA